MSLISSTFVIAVHDEILIQTGVGRAGCHIDKLESVLNRIDQQMYYSGVNDIFEIAAWFGIAISKGHAFVDGNKRTGLAVMLTYLEIQGCTWASNPPSTWPATSSSITARWSRSSASCPRCTAWVRSSTRCS